MPENYESRLFNVPPGGFFTVRYTEEHRETIQWLCELYDTTAEVVVVRHAVNLVHGIIAAMGEGSVFKIGNRRIQKFRQGDTQMDKVLRVPEEDLAASTYNIKDLIPVLAELRRAFHTRDDEQTIFRCLSLVRLIIQSKRAGEHVWLVDPLGQVPPRNVEVGENSRPMTREGTG